MEDIFFATVSFSPALAVTFIYSKTFQSPPKSSTSVLVVEHFFVFGYQVFTARANLVLRCKIVERSGLKGANGKIFILKIGKVQGSFDTEHKRNKISLR